MASRRAESGSRLLEAAGAGRSVWLLAGLALTAPLLGGESGAAGAGGAGSEASGCLACHAGIEAIRDDASPMMQAIFRLGRVQGDPAGCVVCHGGDPAAATKEAAHGGSGFYADPGSPWVNAKTCGLETCHPQHVAAQWNSVMMTEAGKIQGVAWAFGSLTGYEHRWGNYDAKNPQNPADRIGTNQYRAYMEELGEKEPGVFPDALAALPDAPTDLASLAERPEQAAFTYLRAECQRCHLGVRGRKERGDYRGMGCSACHMPYSGEGLYEGGDRSLPVGEPGHVLVHSMQSTRKSEVTVHGTTYSGIPVETCTTCHNRGKRIGVSYQGLMESAFDSPYTEGGGGQLPLHTKHYIAMVEDIHYQKGMLCQDCHTSGDVHGDGFLACANLAQVEIECSDCHGTPDRYPWELPIGFMDEFAESQKEGEPRGVLASLHAPLDQGTAFPGGDGYLVSARGNPMPEVLRRGDLVVVHTAGGEDLELKPLKLLWEQNDLDIEAAVAMCEVEKHMHRMECYACHSTWAPQHYGSHVKIDYSGGKKSFDWAAAGRLREQPEHAADRGEDGYDTVIPGEISESRSYMRFEDPALAINGEGRVTPAAPGCQAAITIVGADGKDVTRNRIFRTLPGSEGAGPEGQLAIDTSPTQPHTTGRARSCESCHLSAKALGHGIDGGRLSRPWNRATTVDLMTAEGVVIAKSARPQIEAIEGLAADWSRFVTEDGRQLQTVGLHFSGSRPLSAEERANTDRDGVCLACHQEIPDQSLAVSFLHHAAKSAGALPKNPAEHSDLVHKTLLVAAWAQMAGAVGAPLVALAAALWWWRRRKRAKAKKAQGGE